MLQRQRFDPDIEVKYHQIMAHMGQKNKVVEQFSRILKDLCDWQMFNSKNLDKFANSISKLLVGKDPLKDTFILFQRMLASKSEQANKIAVSIKQDMLPFLQKAIDLKQQNSIRSQQIQIKQLRLNMQQKIRQLYGGQIRYKNMCQKMKHVNNNPSIQSREKIQQITKIKRQLLDSQNNLTEIINIYNHSVQDYMLNYTKLCQQLSALETQRKTTIKQSISKYIVFQMDAIKNIQYDLCRHAKSIEKMEDKLIIQDKVGPNHGVGEEIQAFQLAKISSGNYIMHLADRDGQKQKGNSFQSDSQRKLSQIKKFLDPSSNGQKCQLKKQSFCNLIWDINDLLTESIQVYDIKTVKQIVFYCQGYYMLSSSPNKNRNASTESNQKQQLQLNFRKSKIPLLNAILCHPLFKNQQFWEKYSTRLSDIVKKQITSTAVTRKSSDQMRISLSFLASDIEFMKKISSSQIVDKILSKYQKYTMQSTQHMLKSTDSIKSKADSSTSKSIKSKIKSKNEIQANDKEKQKKYRNQSDFMYF